MFSTYRSLMLVILFFVCTACTTLNLYNAVKQNRLQECDKMLGERKAECIAQYELTYEEYTEEKEKVGK